MKKRRLINKNYLEIDCRVIGKVSRKRVLISRAFNIMNGRDLIGGDKYDKKEFVCQREAGNL